MPNNKHTLQKANEAVQNGDNDKFLDYCTDDIIWHFIGDRTIAGKEAVRRYMYETYKEPPRFDIEDLLADGDLVTAIGKISLADESGKAIDYSYCDVWRFRDGKMAELRAFVIAV